jgi:NTP pyrophosphatase (non-canonical NTP hydrolase)
VGDPHLEEIQERLERFRDEREWGQFHTLANLAAAISVEAGELLELLLWSPPMPEDEIVAHKREEIEAELADVLIQCLNFASAAEIDVLAALDRKIEENTRKYPVSLSRGKATKYSDL